MVRVRSVRMTLQIANDVTSVTLSGSNDARFYAQSTIPFAKLSTSIDGKSPNYGRSRTFEQGMTIANF
jgi:hypothetical protein